MIDIDEYLGRSQKTIRQSFLGNLADSIDPDQRENSKYRKYQRHLEAFFVEELGVAYLTDAQKELLAAIDNPSYQIIVVISATGVGKTFTMAGATIGLYKSHKKIEIYTAAAPPEENLKRLLWGEIGSIVNNRPQLFEGDTVRNLNIQRVDKEFILGVPIPQGGAAREEEMEAKFSGKHQENLYFFFDEGDAIPDPVYKGADGCMSGGNAKMVICFNPRKKSGAVYRMIQERRAHVISMSAFDHPNVVSGRNMIPGAVTRETTCRRINEWCEPLPFTDDPDHNCFLLPTFLEGYVAHTTAGEELPPLMPGYYRIVDSQFHYKVIGQFPPSADSQLIRDEWIDAAYARYAAFVAEHGEKPPRGIRPTMGLDVADMGPDFNVASFKYGNLIAPLIRWNGVDPDMTADRGNKYYKEKNARLAHVDGIGVGSGVAPKMSRLGCRAHGITANDASRGFTPDGEFKILRDEAYWNLREWFRNELAMVPYDKRLDEALRTITYAIVGKNIVVEPKPKLIKRLGYSPDEMESVMLHFAPNDTWMGGI